MIEEEVWKVRVAVLCDRNEVLPTSYLKRVFAAQLLYAAGVPKERLMTSQGKELVMSLVGQVELAAAMFGVTTADIAARATAIVEGEGEEDETV